MVDLDIDAVCEPAERGLFQALRGEEGALDPADREGWREVCEVALRTFSAPLLHATLVQGGRLEALPEEVVVRLARMRVWNTARWRLAARQVQAIGVALGAAGLDCIVLKGAHVGRLYGAPGARPLGDIDLLVRGGDVDAAWRCLRALGYAPRDPDRWRRTHLDHRHLPPLKIRGGLAVELHHTLAEGAEEVPWEAAVWDRTVPLEGAGSARGMEPLDALLYTCKHLAVHHLFQASNGIAALADVGVLVRRLPEDPEGVRARAEAWGIEPAVALCLRLARDLLGAKVPPDLLQALEVPGLERAAPSAVWLLLHVGAIGTTRHLQLATRATLNPAPPVVALRGARPVRAVWNYARAAALPPVDDVRLEHPWLARRGLGGLGYPLLWSRQAWRHAGLVRLADPRLRAAARARRDAHRQAVGAWLGEGR